MACTISSATRNGKDVAPHRLTPGVLAQSKQEGGVLMPASVGSSSAASHRGPSEAGDRRSFSFATGTTTCGCCCSELRQPPVPRPPFTVASSARGYFSLPRWLQWPRVALSCLKKALAFAEPPPCRLGRLASCRCGQWDPRE